MLITFTPFYFTTWWCDNAVIWTICTASIAKR